MLHTGLGLALIGLVATAQASGADEDFFAPGQDLLTTQLVYSGAGFSPAYRFSASVALTRPADTAPIGAGGGGITRLPPIAKPQAETFWATTSHWQQAFGGDRISLQHLLSVEFKGRLADIKFRPRSVLIEGERLKVTLRPQSALIEGGRLKVMLQPHSAYMQWRKPF